MMSEPLHVRVVDALDTHKGVLYPALKQLMAEAWDEGRESVATDFLNPMDARGIREASTNPYKEAVG